MCAQSCPTLYDPMDYIARQTPPSMEFSGQGCWSGLSIPPAGDLLDPGIEPASPMFPALAGGVYHWLHLGSPSSAFNFR